MPPQFLFDFLRYLVCATVELNWGGAVNVQQILPYAFLSKNITRAGQRISTTSNVFDATTPIMFYFVLSVFADFFRWSIVRAYTKTERYAFFLYWRSVHFFLFSSASCSSTYQFRGRAEQLVGWFSIFSRVFVAGNYTVSIFWHAYIHIFAVHTQAWACCCFILIVWVAWLHPSAAVYTEVWTLRTVRVHYFGYAVPLVTELSSRRRIGMPTFQSACTSLICSHFAWIHWVSYYRCREVQYAAKTVLFLLAGVLYIPFASSFPPYVWENITGNTAGNASVGRIVGQYENP